MATFLSVIETSKENNITLQRVSCIYYLIGFKKKEVQALIDLRSKVNAIILVYALELSLKVYHIKVGAQKMIGSTLDTFEMVLANF